MGGDIEVFSEEGRVKFWEEKSRVQSPESRVQGPVQLLGYARHYESCLLWTRVRRTTHFREIL